MLVSPGDIKHHSALCPDTKLEDVADAVTSGVGMTGILSVVLLARVEGVELLLHQSRVLRDSFQRSGFTAAHKDQG
jgi:hypothetical protein